MGKMVWKEIQRVLYIPLSSLCIWASAPTFPWQKPAMFKGFQVLLRAWLLFCKHNSVLTCILRVVGRDSSSPSLPRLAASMYKQEIRRLPTHQPLQNWNNRYQVLPDKWLNQITHNKFRHNNCQLFPLSFQPAFPSPGPHHEQTTGWNGTEGKP